MYKNLDVWHDAILLIQDIYKIADLLPKSEEFNLKAQMKRAVVSVALNIAEGKTRKSAKEFSHFLNISVASFIFVLSTLILIEIFKISAHSLILSNICSKVG